MMTLEPIIRESIRTGASDIHLSVGIPPILRIHGKLEKVGNYSLTAEDTESLANELLNEEEMEFFEEEGEIDVAYTFLEICRYRVVPKFSMLRKKFYPIHPRFSLSAGVPISRIKYYLCLINNNKSLRF